MFIFCPSKDFKKREAGQALIVILLVSAIGLTLGLSLASRTTQDTNITTEIEESSRAFSAAEAGLEESAQHIGEIGYGPGTVKLSGGGSYEVSISKATGYAEPFQFPGSLVNNQPVTIWLVEHNDDGTLNTADSFDGDKVRICWGGGDSQKAALEFTLYYAGITSKGEYKYKLAREVVNPSDETIVKNALSAVSAGGGECDGEYSYYYDVVFASMRSFEPYKSSDTLFFMKVRPIIKNDGKTRIAVDPLGKTLKTQGEIHTSIGKTESGQQTKLIQFISHPVPPEIFDAVIYTKSKLIKEE